MHVVGTAGHIDHGKSTLIKALTGVDPDRLKEEKERGMTIDLGFTFLTLPSGREIGIVDVPGHHRFIRNMLAGASGVDLALFVVAATESWMQQTQEHLEILKILTVSRGIVVLTKCDLVDDEWIEMVVEEVQEKVEGSFLQDAPIVQVDSLSGRGIENLKKLIDHMLETAPLPVDYGQPRLWIDRVFTVKGSGTVVTGTLLGGSIEIDDELEVVPSGELVRVRGMQLHNRQISKAPIGGRVALNIAGMYTDLHRGDALVAPEQIQPSSRLNVVLRTVSELERPIPQLSEMKIYIGTAERIARIKLLDRTELGAGEEALAQIEIDRPCAAKWQDRFVIRDPAHHATTGGGVILDPNARPVRGKQHRYRRADFSEMHRVLVGIKQDECLDLDLLRSRIDPSEQQLLKTLLRERGWIEYKDLNHLIPRDQQTIDEAVRAVVTKQEAIRLPSFLVQHDVWQRLRARIQDELSEYHEEYPLRAGEPRETLRSSLGIDWRFFDEVIDRCEQEGILATQGAQVRLASHRVTFTGPLKAQVDALMNKLRENPYSPPSIDELVIQGDLKEDLIGALAEQGEIVRVGKNLVFASDVYQNIKERIITHIESQGHIDVAALRDLLGTSRKYALPLLEHFDQIDVTKRVGDTRVLGPKARLYGA